MGEFEKFLEKQLVDGLKDDFKNLQHRAIVLPHNNIDGTWIEYLNNEPQKIFMTEKKEPTQLDKFIDAWKK